MKEFKEYFSMQEFKKIITSDDKYEETDALHQALDQFLTENNLIKPFTNHKTHRTNFGHYWDNYNNNTIEDYQKERVLGNIIDKFFFLRIAYEKDIEKAYEALNTKINKGDFQPFDLVDTLYDFESGQDFMLSFKNWQPSLVVYIPGETLQTPAKFELAQEEEIKKVIEGKITFKTGNLIIADWFKIDEFTQKVDKDNNFEINSEKGRINQAKYYLDTFNFIHTTSWSSSDLYQKDNTFIFTHYDEDFDFPKDYQELGHVDKELRALSIIEKEHLIDLVESEEKVEQYLKDAYGMLEIKVTPGTYTFTMASSPELIKKEMTQLNSVQTKENQSEIKKLLRNKHFEPILIMQGLELQPKNKLKMK
jgi:hypothetical protein